MTIERRGIAILTTNQALDSKSLELGCFRRRAPIQRDAELVQSDDVDAGNPECCSGLLAHRFISV